MIKKLLVIMLLVFGLAAGLFWMRYGIDSAETNNLIQEVPFEISREKLQHMYDFVRSDSLGFH